MPEEGNVKPGYKTTEFWLTVAAMVIGLLLQSDALVSSPAILKAAAAASQMLALLGYQYSRATVKK
jgi:hypothetical protein